MDPVTTAIINGIAAGAASGLATTATAAVVDSYNALKGMITEKFGKDSVLPGSIRVLEQRPESKNKQEGVAEEVADTGADKDDNIVAAANQLLELLKEVQPKAVYQAKLKGSGTIVQGNNNVAGGKNSIVIGGNVSGGINKP